MLLIVGVSLLLLIPETKAIDREERLGGGLLGGLLSGGNSASDASGSSGSGGGGLLGGLLSGLLGGGGGASGASASSGSGGGGLLGGLLSGLLGGGGGGGLLGGILGGLLGGGGAPPPAPATPPVQGLTTMQIINQAIALAIDALKQIFALLQSSLSSQQSSSGINTPASGPASGVGAPVAPNILTPRKLFNEEDEYAIQLLEECKKLSSLNESSNSACNFLRECEIRNKFELLIKHIPNYSQPLKLIISYLFGVDENFVMLNLNKFPKQNISCETFREKCSENDISN